MKHPCPSQVLDLAARKAGDLSGLDVLSHLQLGACQKSLIQENIPVVDCQICWLRDSIPPGRAIALYARADHSLDAHEIKELGLSLYGVVRLDSKQTH